MKKLLIKIAATTLLLSLTSSAWADVIYRFQALSSYPIILENLNPDPFPVGAEITGSFSYVSKEFISRNLSVPISSITNCIVISPIPSYCSDQQKFYEDTHTFSLFQPEVAVQFLINDDPLLSPYYYFPSIAFETFGDFTTNQFQGYQDGRLSVRYLAAVPEPSSWAMMLIGCGLVGGAMRMCSRGWRHAMA